MSKSRLRIIVTGLVGLYPVGGVAWDYLQYVTGLHKMGHDVYYHEDTWSWPYHPLERTYTQDPRYSVGYIENFFKRYAPGLGERWHYLHLHEASYGMSREKFDEVAASADLFLNISGACMIPENLPPRCSRIFLDTDPGYNQIMLSERFAWSENVERWCESVAQHDQHFTYAENIHGPDCLVPKLDFNWKTTRMPVDLGLWEEIIPVRPSGPWTTVMTWNAFKGKLVYKGVEYGSKGAEFEKLMDLPLKVKAPLKVAIGGVNAPLDRLAQAGWEVADGPEATVTPAMYQDFIASSRGEISPAKHVYVALRTGWFSCRSACYLAAGRPVVVQDTGFSNVYPSGEGLVAYSSADEAVEALAGVEADYGRHAKAALEIARDCFDAGKVLQKLIEDAFAG
ncbi:MAG: glycosyltransferase family 1 protein [Syntrophobacter sp.]